MVPFSIKLKVLLAIVLAVLGVVVSLFAETAAEVSEKPAIDKQAVAFDDGGLPDPDLLPDWNDQEVDESVQSASIRNRTRIYTVVQRVIIRDGRIVPMPVGKMLFSIESTSNEVLLCFGKNEVPFSIMQAQASIVESRRPSLEASVSCIRAMRVVGPRVEHLTVTDETVMLVSTAYHTKDVMVTYAQRKRGLGTTIASNHLP